MPKLGYKQTKEHAEKSRKAAIGNKGPLGKHWKVKDTSKYTGQNSLGCKHDEKFKAARRSYRHTDDAKKRIGIASSKRIGEKNNNWKGGNSYSYLYKNTKDLANRSKPERCEICNTFAKDFKKGLCFDHNHKTGKFRGWICLRCNFAIGLVKEDTDVLKKIIKYLQSNE